MRSAQYAPALLLNNGGSGVELQYDSVCAAFYAISGPEAIAELEELVGDRLYRSMLWEHLLPPAHRRGGQTTTVNVGYHKASETGVLLTTMINLRHTACVSYRECDWHVPCFSTVLT